MDAGSRFFLGAATLGLVLRLAFGLLYWNGQPMTRDEHEYLSLARSLAAGHGFVYDDVIKANNFEPFGRAPGYPAFLALVGGGRGVPTEVPASVKVAQSVVGALGVLMVGVLTRRIAGPAAARAAVLIAAVYPPLVWVAGYALSEAMFWPIGLACAWMFDRLVVERRGAAAALLCGAMLGVGILIRPALVLFVPLAGLVLLWKRRWIPMLVLGAGVLLVVGPWTARNFAHHGRFIFVASEGGVTFWTGNHPLAVGDGDLAANMPIKLDNLRLRAEHPGLSEEALEPIYYQEALTWIRENPDAWIALEFRKLFYMVVPVGPSYTLHSARYYAASVVSYLAVLGLAVAGWLSLRGTSRLTPGLWVLLGSAVLVSLAFFPQERFRIPIIDPTLVILAGVGLASIRRARAHA